MVEILVDGFVNSGLSDSFQNLRLRRTGMHCKILTRMDVASVCYNSDWLDGY